MMTYAPQKMTNVITIALMRRQGKRSALFIENANGYYYVTTNWKPLGSTGPCSPAPKPLPLWWCWAQFRRKS